MKQVRVNSGADMGAISTKIAVSADLIAVADTAYRLMSISGSWLWAAVPNTAGGLVFGVAAPGYTTAQIEEWLEATTSIDRLDRIANERANRKIRQIGIFDSTSLGGNAGDVTFNDGKVTTTKLNWAVPIGGQPQFWGYNADTAALAVGSNLNFTGKATVKYGN